MPETNPTKTTVVIETTTSIEGVKYYLNINGEKAGEFNEENSDELMMKVMNFIDELI